MDPMVRFDFHYSITFFVVGFFFIYFLLFYFGMKSRQYRYLGYIIVTLIIHMISYDYVFNLITSDNLYIEYHDFFTFKSYDILTDSELLMLIIPLALGVIYGINFNKKPQNNDKDKDTN